MSLEKQTGSSFLTWLSLEKLLLPGDMVWKSQYHALQQQSGLEKPLLEMADGPCMSLGYIFVETPRFFVVNTI